MGIPNLEPSPRKAMMISAKWFRQTVTSSTPHFLSLEMRISMMARSPTGTSGLGITVV